MNIIDLTNVLSIIEVKGIDSAKFLQGQLTNDINQLDQKTFQFSAHLNNKGRMLASFIISKANHETYYLITSSEIIDKIIPRLKMFVLRSKVEIQTPILHINFGETVPNALLNIALKDSRSNISITHETITQNQDTQIWKYFLIENGIPFIYPDTYEEFTPQQINYDLFDGVNFKKGCYTGQEIVARTHYLGKVKRRMYKFRSNTKPIIGQIITSPKLDNQEVGFVVDTIKHQETYVGLASIQTDCTDNVFLKDTHSKLETQPINY